MKIKVRYFASFREQANKTQEELETSSNKASDLYDDLCTRYDFTLNKDEVKVSINGKYGPFNSTLNEGDEVVFIPPVSGG